MRVVAERADVRGAQRVRQQARFPRLAAHAVEVIPREIEVGVGVGRGSRAERAAGAERQKPEPAAERGGRAAPEKRATRLARFVVPAPGENRLRLGGSARRERRVPRLVHARLAPVGRDLAQERSKLRAARGGARREAAREEPRDPRPRAPFRVSSRRRFLSVSFFFVRVFVGTHGRDDPQEVEVVVRVPRDTRQRRGERRAFQSRLRRVERGGGERFAAVGLVFSVTSSSRVILARVTRRVPTGLRQRHAGRGGEIQESRAHLVAPRAPRGDDGRRRPRGFARILLVGHVRATRVVARVRFRRADSRRRGRGRRSVRAFGASREVIWDPAPRVESEVPKPVRQPRVLHQASHVAFEIRRVRKTHRGLHHRLLHRAAHAPVVLGRLQHLQDRGDLRVAVAGRRRGRRTPGGGSDGHRLSRRRRGRE